VHEERPLAGIRVLDLSRLLPGPFATMVLADLGAQVDKVEDPAGGDYLRLMPPLVGSMNATFHALNRGKRSLVLDLKRPDGREAFSRLAARYDVLVESFRPGVMKRLGLGYDALAERNPRLVYCAITGYGQTGPLADRAGHDLNYLARAGVLGVSGPTGGPPQVPGVQVADVGGGALFAVAGVLAALEARHHTGRGRFVDVSMCEGALAFGLYGIGNRLAGVATPAGDDVLTGGIAPYGTYLTKDGRAVSLGALEPKFWTAFCVAVGIPPDLQALALGPHQAEWKSRLAGIFAGRTRDAWAEFARAHDVCLEPVLDPEELPGDEQHASRGIFLEGPTGDGSFPQPRTPIARPAAAPAPRQGEQGPAVLADAGFGPEEIAALQAAGATR